MESRATLRLYRNKVGICEEGIYRNVFGSVLMLRCRTNTLKLRWRDGFYCSAVDYLLCGAEKETVDHFVMICEGIRMIRERHGVRGGVRVDEVLLFEGRTEEMVDGFTKMLEEMWTERGRLIESKAGNVLRNGTDVQ